jgi:hypothetical protein
MFSKINCHLGLDDRPLADSLNYSFVPWGHRETHLTVARPATIFRVWTWATPTGVSSMLL